jgi:catechol 2,3-dioxygenase-like lactoylglutathione lyase family enzyme
VIAPWRDLMGWAILAERWMRDAREEAMLMDVERLRSAVPPPDLPFEVRKLGHVVIRAADLGRSVEFYTRVLGFRVSDVYPEEMVPGGMVFMRMNADHHGIALVGGMPGPAEKRELHHVAFEVDTLDEVFRARQHLRERGVTLVFEGRRRAGGQIAVEFLDPDGHHLEIYWGVDQVGPDGRVRPKEEWRQAHSLEEAVATPVAGQDVLLRDRSLLEPR